MRLFMLWALWVIVEMIVPDPNEWMLLQVPWKAPEVLWNRLLEQQIAILADFEHRFVSQWPIWIGLGVAYFYEPGATNVSKCSAAPEPCAASDISAAME